MKAHNKRAVNFVSKSSLNKKPENIGFPTFSG